MILMPICYLILLISYISDLEKAKVVKANGKDQVLLPSEGSVIKKSKVNKIEVLEHLE